MIFRLISVIFLLASGGQGHDQSAQKGADARTPYVEKSEKQFAFYPGGRLEISAAAPGSLTISGWDNSSVRVEMEKIFYYMSPEQAQELARRYPVRVTWTPSSARISTAGSPKPGATMEVNVRIFVPRERTDVNIKLIKGDLSLSAFNGWVEASLEEGNIEAKDLSGYCSIATKLGDLNVELSGKRWTGYGFTAGTRRGAIDLRLPIDYSAALQLETENGKISLDYPEQVVEGESVPLQVVADKKKRAVRAPIGSGGAPVRLGTSLGDITFKGK